MLMVVKFFCLIFFFIFYLRIMVCNCVIELFGYLVMVCIVKSDFQGGMKLFFGL